ncbi:MAG: hypothetical protein ACR2NS_12375 [Gemmatimonadaceae bacterium]
MQPSLFAALSFSTVLLAGVVGCSHDKTSAQSLDQTARAQVKVETPKVAVSRSSAVGCDASLWNHVYNPTRLQKLAPCLSATGVISESDADRDGDQHFLLKLDPGQDSLVNHRNAKKKGGELVVEIVCANPTTMKKVKSACTGYTNPIAIPAVGAHVRVTGTWVIDSHNGWEEVHPVSSIQVSR